MFIAEARFFGQEKKQTSANGAGADDFKSSLAASASDLPMAVRDIRDRLEESGRELAHTSVITTLNIMLDKGFLKRSKLKNAFLFTPKVKQTRSSRESSTMCSIAFLMDPPKA